MDAGGEIARKNILAYSNPPNHPTANHPVTQSGQLDVTMLAHQLTAQPPCIISCFPLPLPHRPVVSVFPKTSINNLLFSHYNAHNRGCATVQCSTTTTSSCHPNGLLQRTVTTNRQERKAAQKRRSFRRRQAPITNAQRKTIRLLWPKHGLNPDYARRWDFKRIFRSYPKHSPVVTLDIGFGTGDSLLGMAAAHPADFFVGIEVHKPGVALALAGLEAEGLSNVKISRGDAVTALMDHIADRSLDRCCIFFPDPFLLQRDADRRLFRPLLLTLLSAKLKIGGTVHVATDVEEYGEHVLSVMKVVQGYLTAKKLDVHVATAAAEVETEQTERPGSEQERGPTERSGPIAREGLEAPVQRIVVAEKGCVVAGKGAVALCWEGGEEVSRPDWRAFTKYEEKAKQAGRRVREFSYRLRRVYLCVCRTNRYLSI